MPKGLTASTGMDALTHAIEGYTTKAAWEMTDMFHLKAIELISKSLRGAVYDTPHGVACAMMLSIVMEYNQECTGEKYREIARAMGVKDVDSMTQEEDLPFLAESAHADACAPGNPKDASVEDLTALFRKIM